MSFVNRNDINVAVKSAVEGEVCHLEDENELAIVVDNSPNDRVYPQMADFTFYGGLYRDVNIVSVNKTHFDLDYYGGTGLVITPEISGADAKVTLDAYAVNLEEGDKLVFTVTDAEGNAVASVEGAEKSVTVDIPAVHKWHGRRDPYLYSAKVEIVRGGEVLDAVSSRFGCRSFEIDPNRGFILNGEEYPLRGVSRHQDRLGIGNAL